MGKAQVQRAKAQRAAQLGAMHHRAADGIRPAQQRGAAAHVTDRQGLTHRRAGHAQPVHLITHHAGDIKTVGIARSVQHGVVAGPLRAKAKVVANQHIARTQGAHQHVVDEGLGGLAGYRLAKAQHHHLVDAAAGQLGQLVAQGADAGGGGRRFAGALGEVVARVRLKGQHTRRHVAVARLAVEQGQHRLVAAVHAVKIAYRDRTTRRARSRRGRSAACGDGAAGVPPVGSAVVLVAPKNLHQRIIAMHLGAPCRPLSPPVATVAPAGGARGFFSAPRPPPRPHSAG